MRIRSLSMKPYGAFTERSITLEPGLNLIVGVNEAGKSTALDALTDFLWGIPSSSPQTFLYGRQALAIRATVQLDDQNDTTVNLVRRSAGLTDEHTGGDAEPTWTASGDTRSRWRDSFGLAHKDLRTGGEQLCRGEGDLAELVFAARSGRRIRDLLVNVRSVADDLYKPHRGNKSVRVRSTHLQYEQAVDAEKQATANSAQVQSAREAVLRSAADVERATQRTTAARTEEETAKRRLSAAPHARNLADALNQERDIISAGPTLSEDQVETHANALHRTAAADGILETKMTELESVTSARADIVVDEAVLADGETIRELHLNAGAQLAGGQRAAELLDEAEHLDRVALKELQDITGPTERTLTQLIADLHVPAERVNHLDALGAGLDEANKKHTVKEQAVREGGKRLRDAEAADTGIPMEAAQAVREAVNAIHADGSATNRQRDAFTKKAEAGRRRDEALRRAGLPVGFGTPASIPSEKALRSASERLKSTRSDETDTARRLEGIQQTLASAEEELGGVTVEGVPDERALQNVRSERDHAVTQVFSDLEDGRTPEDVPALRTHLQGTIAQADDMADALRRYADDAARLAEVTTRIALHRADLDETTGLLANRSEAVAVAEGAWHLMWSALGATAPEPDTALLVHQHLIDAREAEEEMVEARDLAASLGEQVTGQATSLRKVLATAERSRPDFNLDALLETAEMLLQEDDKARETRAIRRQLALQNADALTERDTAATELENVHRAWRDLLRTCNLPDDLSSAAWSRRRDILHSAQESRDKAEDHRQTGNDARDLHEEWAQAVAHLAQRHNVVANPPEDAIATLSTRFEAARAARDEAKRLDSEAGKLTAVIEKQQGIRTLAHDELQALLSDVGLKTLDALNEAASRTKESQKLATEIAARRALVRTALHDHQADDTIEELDEVLHAAVDAAHTKVTEAEEALRESIAANATAMEYERKLINAPGAAEQHARAQESLAAVADYAEQFLVAHIQATVLERELDAYERKHASPLLDGAGTFLERLTGGRYVAFAARDLPTGRSLEIIGADEERHGPQDLSEGTADQVYLALRLAGIASLQAERANEGAPTLPVVLDDILMTFDDARATAALQVMAELADKWQIIVFSHHSHLADLATNKIPTAHVSRLDHPPHITASRAASEVRERAHTPVQQHAPTRSPSARKMKTGAEPNSDPGAIREWARRQGHSLGNRGRIPANITADYNKAHAGLDHLA
ncbi:AAA family ATPase [Arthrobacter echini]|uniref:AAA family ATPase n=1 Tax=Arthrobacter echini TaxID=1529066 RepID=A0A5D0XHQ6_9MICC|nr:histone-like nucleoid-structuring protein Lsr2 [Arthrobacter echini]TYC95963.1 AAA family ATPase [Arthrobacter echini]